MQLCEENKCGYFLQITKFSKMRAESTVCSFRILGRESWGEK